MHFADLSPTILTMDSWNKYQNIDFGEEFSFKVYDRIKKKKSKSPSGLYWNCMHAKGISGDMDKHLMLHWIWCDHAENMHNYTDNQLRAH